jgi:hypothetical protein
MADQVKISTTNTTVHTTIVDNKVTVVDTSLPHVVKILQPVTDIVKVGIPGLPGPPGSSTNIDTGSFATTGSNIFTGNQIISGSDLVQVIENIYGTIIIGTEDPVAPSGLNSIIIQDISGNDVLILDPTGIVFTSGSNGLVITMDPSSSVGISGLPNASYIMALNSASNPYPITQFQNAENYTDGSVRFYTGLNLNQYLISSASILTTAGFTGSLSGTASYSQTASYTTTASYVLNAISSSYALTASNILGGRATHIPFFITDTTLATSSLYQSGSGTVIINQDNATSANPEALYVWQPSDTSFNVISGKGNLNNYLQLNISNTNQGTNASSDVVATANNGNENINYIDMGINSQNFAGYLGGPNDSYLYSTGRNMWIGNVTDNNYVYIFNSSSLSPIIILTPDSKFTTNADAEITGSLKVTRGITGSLLGTASYSAASLSASYALTASYALNVPSTASYALRALTASYALNVPVTASYAISASYAINAGNADNATYATTAGNGGVTQLVAGSGISLIPAGGQGVVTIVSSGGGGTTILSGSNTTQSFSNSSTWTFTHNLGVRTPIIEVFDSNYNQMIPQTLQLTDTSSATITFPVPKSGFAIASIGGTTGTVLSSSYSLFSTYANTASYYTESDPVFASKSGSFVTTSSFNSFTSSYKQDSSSFSSNINSLTSATSSYVLNSQTSSMSVLSSSYATTASYYKETDPIFTAKSASLATTGSNTFIGTQIVTGSLFTSGSNTLVGNTVLSGSINISGSSIIQGTTTMSGSLSISGSTTQIGNNTLIGTTTLTGSILINGDIIPQISSSFSLGSVTNPWKSLFVQSGSIYIASDTPGGAAATISNKNGNVSITVAGFQIVSGSSVPFLIDTSGRTKIFTPNIPANDQGAFSIVGSSDGYAQTIGLAGRMVHITGNDTLPSRIENDSFGAGAFPAYIGRNARGIASSPSASQTGDILSRLAALGYGATGYLATNINSGPPLNSIDFVAKQNYNDVSASSAIEFYTSPQDKRVRTLSATIDTTGITIPSSSLLFGTASWALNSQTSSYVLQAVSSSYATTSSYAPRYVLISQTSSFATTGSNTFIGNQTISGSIIQTGSLTVNGPATFNDLTVTITGSLLVTGSSTLIGNQTVTGSIIVSGSLLMDNTAQNLILKTSITNPSSYAIYTFSTASYHGANYNFTVTEDSTGKSTTYNVLVASGNNKVANIQTYLVKSEGSAPTPTIATAINGSNIELRITDTGTFTYRGIVQLF